MKERINELEMAVMERFLADPALALRATSGDYSGVLVASRDLTGAGFLTTFEKCSELRMFEEHVSMRWGKVGARLTPSKIETGYLVYVDDGYLSAIEGYTYGEEWPSDCSVVELYDLKPGMEL